MPSPDHFDAAAEIAVLTLALRDPECWADLRNVVYPHDFGSPELRALFAVLDDFFSAGRAFDPVLIRNAVQPEHRELFDSLLDHDEIYASPVSEYAALIHEHGQMRRLHGLINGLQRLATQGELTASELLGRVQSAVVQLTATTSQNAVELGPLVRQCLEAIQQRAESGDALMGLPTGFADLDRRLGGLRVADQVVLAGRPSMGKTALATVIALNVVLLTRLPALIFSLEMTADQLTERILSALSGVPLEHIRNATLTSADRAALNVAAETLKQLPLLIDDSSDLSAADIRSRARVHALRYGGLGLVMVDYVGLVRLSGENRVTGLGEASRAFKQMAKELGCVSLILSQLNRSVEQRPNKRPLLSDLRESGDIEQDADIVMFVYRDGYYNEHSPHPDRVEVITRKFRNGKVGTDYLTFHGDQCAFADAEPIPEQQQIEGAEFGY